MNVFNSFCDVVSRNRDKTAIVYLGSEITYGELLEKVNRFAYGIISLGIKEKERVIIYLPNSPQWIISWLGILKVGAVSCPVTPIYTVHDLRHIVENSGAAAVICSDTNFGYVKELKEEGLLKTVIIAKMGDMLPFYKRVIGKGFDVIPEGKVKWGDGVVKFKDLLNVKSSEIIHDVDKHQTLEILFTGGTTKHPKGVPISHVLFLESVKAQLEVSHPVIPASTNVILQGAPLFHILGQVFGVGSLCITGDTVVLMPRVNLDAFLHAIEKYKVKTFFGVPTIYRMILEHERLDYYDLSSLVYCFCAGDVLPIEIEKRWRKKFGIEIFQGYGATETCGGVFMSPVDEEKPAGTLGRLVYTKKIRIADESAMEVTGNEKTGELLVHSGHMVEHYWNNDEETEDSFVNIEGMLWYKTGDIVRMDVNGFFYFVDRGVDTIKHKGYRVSASEVEAVLQEHPAVSGSCVVGVEDEKVGERIKAFVVLKRDVKGITGYDLIHWCRDRLAPYKVPGHIEFRDMLPKSKVGKILRRELRRDEKKRAEEY